LGKEPTAIAFSPTYISWRESVFLTSLGTSL
jgi:hypothetical protein